jgi:hypothetical protein
MSHHTRKPSNLEALDRYWRRSPFHDQEVREITALNRRVLIRLKEMSLVITGATDLKLCELPAVWLSESFAQEGGKLILDVQTDTGQIRVTGADVRLIRNNDLTVLVPPIDT